jgi:hypothetical protein
MFETHKLNEAGFKKVFEFKNALSLVVSAAMKVLPEGRDKAIFKTKIEEAVFFGTRAIAADPANHTEVINYQETP